MRKLLFSLISLAVIFSLVGCTKPTPGPDKTIGAGVIGAGWGAGAGAIIGHQLSYAGEGALVGAGFGLLGAAMAGSVYDHLESNQLRQENQLMALKARNQINASRLAQIQGKLDRALQVNSSGIGVFQVYFDVDETSLRSGAVKELENLAEMIKTNPYAKKVFVIGHTDDAGEKEYNEKVALARAQSVSGVLAAHGISSNQIMVEGKGSAEPVANNESPQGRQFNRRVDVFVSNR